MTQFVVEIWGHVEVEVVVAVAVAVKQTLI